MITGLACIVLANDKETTRATFLERAIAYFSKHAIEQTMSLMTDHA